MKKSLIALAVAGALTAPIVAQADATLYGIAQFRLIDQDTKSLNAQESKARLGVKGTVDNDIEGLTTGYQIEWNFTGANNDADGIGELRKSLVFLKGDFGQLTAGKQNNPAAAVKKADVFNKNSGALTIVPDRIENAIAYATPTVGGVQGHVGFTADGAADAGSEDVDAYVVGATYSVEGLGLAVAYSATNNTLSNTDSDVTGFGASYKVGDLYLGASYEAQDNDASADVDSYDLAVKFGVTDKVTLGAGFAAKDVDGAADEQERALVAVNYALGGGAGLNVEYADYNSEAETAGKNDNLVLQYTLKF